LPSLSITQSAAQTVLRSFLTTLLPNVNVIEAQNNRVPEPANVNFIVMTAIRRDRIETNTDSYVDVLFTGSINGTVLTATSFSFGALFPGNQIFGVLLASPTTIVNQITGPVGGVGIYTISPSQNIASELLAAGTQSLLSPTELTYQLDVHSNIVDTAATMAQIITTAFRDPYAFDFFTAQNPNVVPLYADEARQVPFVNAEEAWETRWVIEAHLQVNAALINLPQQFAGALSVGLVDVNATYPP
jgi:hypothetical protein